MILGEMKSNPWDGDLMRLQQRLGHLEEEINSPPSFGGMPPSPPHGFGMGPPSRYGLSRGPPSPFGLPMSRQLYGRRVSPFMGGPPDTFQRNKVLSSLMRGSPRGRSTLMRHYGGPSRPSFGGGYGPWSTGFGRGSRRW